MLTSLHPRIAELKAIRPCFASARWVLVVAAIGAAVASGTDAAVAEMRQALVDHGFKQVKLPLWMIQLAIIPVFALRGVGGSVAQYAMAWAQNRTIIGRLQFKSEPELVP